MRTVFQVCRSSSSDIRDNSNSCECKESYVGDYLDVSLVIADPG